MKRLRILPVLYGPSASYPLKLYVSVGEFDGVFVPREESIWGYRHVTFLKIFNRFWTAKEGMDSFRLFLEFSQVGSGIRQMSCPSPATQDCRGYIDLCPSSYVAYGADQA